VSTLMHISLWGC